MQFINQFGLWYLTPCTYQFIYEKFDENGTHMFQYLVLSGLGCCLKFQINVTHNFIHGNSDTTKLFCLLYDG